MLDRANTYGSPALWVRKAYRAGFRDRTIRAVVRPKDRRNTADPTHIPGEVAIPVRFINNPGTDTSAGAPGDLLSDDGTTIMRTGCIVKSIGELTNDDLARCSPDCRTQELVRYHLAAHYNMELPGYDYVVTVWLIDHLPDAVA